MKKYTKDIFILKSIEKHGDKYNYSLVEYIGSTFKVNILCKQHGVFTMKPKEHLSGQGCIKCSCKGMDTNKFIYKSKKIFGDLYDYSKVNYINNKTKIEIICKKHDSWLCLPDPHYLRKVGCPKCNTSKGENEIKQYLGEKNVNFIFQHKFENCINPKTKRKLPFDFYLPNENICIEYDGELHYNSIEYYGGNKKLIDIKYRDSIKTQFCLDNNINLLRISYKDSIINNIKNINYG
jgi:hypothetical protein